MVNVDPKEIEKFSEIASRWWDPEGEFKPLHLINPLRLNYIDTRVNGLFGKRTLDIGCGGGILCESMVNAGANVTGIDMAEASLEIARLHSIESDLEVDYQCVPAEEFAEQHRHQFDVVTCLEMLEHVPDPASIIRACATLVKPGGDVFFSTLNRNIKSYIMGILGAEYILGLVPKGTHEHNRFIRPSELLKMTDDVNLQAADITGLHMNLISQTFYLSNKNVDVNYLLHCKAPIL